MASIKLKGDTSGEVTISAPSVAGTTTLELPATSSTLATQNSLGVRNLIINGDMRIAQRGTSATGLGNGDGGYHTVDRWRFGEAGAATCEFTMSQDSDTPTGQGFSNSVKFACTTTQSPIGASDLITFRQRIEGQNLQHLAYGSSSAKTLTISFWVKSNKTGTYITEYYQPDAARIQSQSYSISAANTWEKKTITISGDTSGQIDNNNDYGLELFFGICAGTDFTSGTLQTSWGTVTNTDRYVGQVNLADSTSNYINITGVQLEVGTEATPFEHRPYDMELARCQRYYYRLYSPGNGFRVSAGYVSNSSYAEMTFYLPVEMRTAPTAIEQTGTASDYNIAYGAGNTNCTSVPIHLGGTTRVTSFRFIASGLTAGHGVHGRLQTSGYLSWSAEL